MVGPPKLGKRNAMVALIEKGEDAILETSHVLGRLWRYILISEGYSGDDWIKLITLYQERMNKLTSEKGCANMKGNLTRSLAELRISWGSLLKGLSILGYTKIEITFRLTKGDTVKEVPFVINDDEMNEDS